MHTRIWIAMLLMAAAIIGIRSVSLLWVQADFPVTGFDWRQLLILIATCVGVGGLLGAWLSRTLVRPLEAILDFARRIASGDLGGRISTTRSDEIRRILRVLNQTNVNLLGIVGMSVPRRRRSTAKLNKFLLALANCLPGQNPRHPVLKRPLPVWNKSTPPYSKPRI